MFGREVNSVYAFSMISGSTKTESGTPEGNRRFIRPRRAAEELDMSPAAIYALFRSGQLRAVKVGRSLRIPIEDYESFCARMKEVAV
jgi:excisionase family DNA binding protein